MYLVYKTGMEHFVMILPMIIASLKVQVPDSHNGINIPGERLNYI